MGRSSFGKYVWKHNSLTISKYVKFNGNNPVLSPLPMMSGRGWWQQEELQGVGGRGRGAWQCQGTTYGFPLLLRSQTPWEVTHSLLLLRQPEEGHCSPSNWDPRERKGQWCLGGAHGRGEGWDLLPFPRFAVHIAGMAPGPRSLLPSTRLWASLKAVKMPCSLWWRQCPAQYLAQSKHVINDRGAQGITCGSLGEQLKATS